MASAALTDELVLFDLPSKAPCRCWSPSVWKARLVLNYKGLPYRTAWVDAPDIEARLKPLNINFHGGSRYTVPTLLFPDGSAIMDSAAIASELERRYPELPAITGLPPHSTALPSNESPEAKADPEMTRTIEFTAILRKLGRPVGSVTAPGIIENVVTDRARPWKMADLGGKSLEEYKASLNVEEVMDNARPAFEELNAFWQRQGTLITENTKKLPWCVVHQLSALLNVGCGSKDLLERILNMEGAERVKQLYESAEKQGWFNHAD